MIAKCVFVEPYVNLAKSPEGVLSEYDKIFSLFILINVNLYYRLHTVESLAWSQDGRRIALSFSALPTVALYAVTQLNQTFTLAPVYVLLL